MLDLHLEKIQELVQKLYAQSYVAELGGQVDSDVPVGVVPGVMREQR